MKYHPPSQREAINSINCALSTWLFLRDHWPSIRFCDSLYNAELKVTYLLNIVSMVLLSLSSP